ncbi:hypothetical protein ACGFIR_02470 [Micromonospora sp. NPDC049051]|uniref:hypothetical protein n=1 Tax=Micromonospora sp. NPDC049051 TaxID=3364264 RepID=UPI003719EA4F
MTKQTVSALRRFIRQTYGTVMWRRLGVAVIAVPSAMRTIASRRFVSGVLALPFAAAATAVTAVLAGLMLVNVGYPLRPLLGLDGHDGSVWASTYYDAWGGPTLAGAWAVHGVGAMLFVFPLLGWVVRGLLRLQAVLTGTAPAAVGAASAVLAPTRVRRPAPRRAGTMRCPGTTPGAGTTPPAETMRRARTMRRAGTMGQARALRRRAGVTAAALLAAYGFALLAHAAGIGDNVLWLPRDFRSGLALAVVLAPVAVAALTVRVWWYPVPGTVRA